MKSFSRCLVALLTVLLSTALVSAAWAQKPILTDEFERFLVTNNTAIGDPLGTPRLIFENPKKITWSLVPPVPRGDRRRYLKEGQLDATEIVAIDPDSGEIRLKARPPTNPAHYYVEVRADNEDGFMEAVLIIIAEPETPKAENATDIFTQRVETPGVTFWATERVDPRKVEYAANVANALLLKDQAGSGRITEFVKRRQAIMTLFYTFEERNTSIGFYMHRRALGFRTQDLEDEEIIPDYLRLGGPEGVRRDASVEEITHLIHRGGITPAYPELQERLEKATYAAIERGFYRPQDGLPEDSFADEYLAYGVDIFYGARRRRSLEGTPLTPENLAAIDSELHEILTFLFPPHDEFFRALGWENELDAWRTASGGDGAGNASDYDDLLALFREFHDFQQPSVAAGVPDYGPEAMAAQARDLANFQSRLAALDVSSWPISEQVDYHLVRAEMNGLEFRHRVLKPWSLDPGFYNDVISSMGRFRDWPMDAHGVAELTTRLRSVRGIVEQAQRNLGVIDDPTAARSGPTSRDLSRVAGDLATLAVLSLGDTRNEYEALAGRIADHHPELLHEIDPALAAIADYIDWIEANKRHMTARAGVGKDNYNWLMKNVYLFPYTWEEIRTIVELEDNRVITFQRLEENRNRDVPPIRPAQSQEEYKASVASAIEHLMEFLVEQEIFTVNDYLTPDEYFGSWHGFDNPWPEKHDYFFNFSHREPVMEETHEMVGHHFDGLRSRNDSREIRGGRRPFKIGTARGEGFAFALEELLMHAGYLDRRNPHGREIAYEQSAFRTVRALADIYMHSGDWSYEDAYEFAVANAPHGELLDGSHHLWFELDTTLRGVGHHMLMVVGKVQFMKLFRDRANQLGDDFNLKDFLDGVLDTGSIPWSLIRWEMTGMDDEIKKLTSE